MKKLFIVVLLMFGTMMLYVNVYADIADINDGLVASYPFNGNANDESGNGNDGEEHGGITYEDGIVDNAVFFDGAMEEYIIAPDSSSLSISNALSICAWVKPTDLDSFLPIITKGYIEEDYTLWVKPNGLSLLLNFDTSYEFWKFGEVYTSETIEANTWYFITATYDLKKVKYYINGNLVFEYEYNHLINTSGEPLYIGSSYPGGDEYFKGYIDELRIYNRALSESEIQQLYNDANEVCKNHNVPGTSDLWLAGMPDGSTASGGDVASDQSPVIVQNLELTNGGILTFQVTGSVARDPRYQLQAPDGASNHSHDAGDQNGIADLIAPIESLIGVFLDDDLPNASPAPEKLNFSNLGLNFTSLSPLLKQAFFIGDGLTDAGEVQQFLIPEGATRLFLGTMDGCCWYNNIGSFNVTITLSDSDEPLAICETPEDSAHAIGDPHLMTFDGLAYDFQAAGEFVYIESTESPQNMTIQVRQQPWGNSSHVSVITAVAMSVEGDTIELYPTRETPLFVNSVPTTLLSSHLELPNGGNLYLSNNSYKIVWADCSQILCSLRGERLDIYAGFSEERMNAIHGLLGNFDDDYLNDLKGRYGNTSIDLATTSLTKEILYGDFTESWRISQEESLFTYFSAEESTETYTDRNFPAGIITSKDLSEDQYNQAKTICQNAGVTGAVSLDSCILDIGLTGDEGFIESFLDTNQSNKTEVVVLTNAEPDKTITANSNTETVIYGSSAENQITIESGAKAKFYNCPGNNIITIQSDSTLFTVFRSGAAVTFEGTDGTKLQIPATQSPQSIVFNNSSMILVIDSGNVMLGNQVIDLVSNQIY